MTLKKLWLVFAQTVTVSLAVLFVVQTLRPEWLGAQTAPHVPVAASQAPATSVAPAPGRAPSYADAATRAGPAVVNVFTSKEVKTARHPFMDDPIFRRFFGEMFESTQRATSLGSGVIVNPTGFILTNNHVIEDADEIQIALPDGRTLAARVIGTDPETDLAVVKVETAEALPAIAFGADDDAKVGDVVLAIGNPFGVGQTVTMGIVSALGRTGLGINTFENFIQTDAAINQGNSGGALVDTSGNLVGVNTAILSRTGGSIGIGFAIPASTARQVMDGIIATGSVVRGYIGVQGQEITPELAESFKLPGTNGVLIAGVESKGPADRAGVKPGDILVAVAGKPVADPPAMLNSVAALRPGAKVPLSLKRQGKDLQVEVEIARRPASLQARKQQR
ncbi:MAG: Do family serine endopeptidase [Burkholderiales bacterium]|jgi:serine protease DegQ|nr:Do family serine endopeptidase [Burkholderiales bacterium]